MLGFRGSVVGEDGIMDILVSWSKTRSWEVAQSVYDWLPNVFPRVKLWISTNDIEIGDEWWEELKRVLHKAKACITCITKDNVNSPWLHYEAGRIAGRKEEVRILPYLFDVTPEEIAHTPLQKYQCAQCAESFEEGTLALVRSLNRLWPRKPKKLDDETLQSKFAEHWPTLEERLKHIPEIEYSENKNVIPTVGATTRALTLTVPPSGKAILVQKLESLFATFDKYWHIERSHGYANRDALRAIIDDLCSKLSDIQKAHQDAIDEPLATHFRHISRLAYEGRGADKNAVSWGSEVFRSLERLIEIAKARLL
jgi:hypothetical protein